MKLIIISGRSGSGKSSALHLLEDVGYYCIDNLPASLLPSLFSQVYESKELIGKEANGEIQLGVSIDARNTTQDLQSFPKIIQTLQKQKIDCCIVYLDARSPVLIKRFSATRRKHPLSNQAISLAEAIAKEKQLLDPIANMADLKIDTTTLSLHQLRSLIKLRVVQNPTQDLAILFESFSYKSGVPVDADYVFDVRCLPNPYWQPELRSQTGLDESVIQYLDQHSEVGQMLKDISSFLDSWLPSFEQNNRSYVTVAIGCTGGQHRSVYMSEKLHQYFSARMNNVQVRHREI